MRGLVGSTSADQRLLGSEGGGEEEGEERDAEVHDRSVWTADGRWQVADGRWRLPLDIILPLTSHF
jgi:hypothetical protein